MKIFLRSEEFGEEEFERDTLEEALACIVSIVKTADDGIRREVGIILFDDENEIEEVE